MPKIDNRTITGIEEYTNNISPRCLQTLLRYQHARTIEELRMFKPRRNIFKRWDRRHSKTLWAIMNTENQMNVVKIKDEENGLYSYKSPVTKQRELVFIRPSQDLTTFYSKAEAFRAVANSGIRIDHGKCKTNPNDPGPYTVDNIPEPEQKLYKHENRTSRMAKACELLDEEENVKRRTI